MKRGSCALVVIILAQAVVLTLGLSAWWAHRNNNLFGNGRWLVGKDNGKFVFYTYGFMFRPLTGGTVDLGWDQGFQELLFHQPEEGERRLCALEFQTAMGGATYFWVQLQKVGLRTLGIRVSRNERHRSGFFEFDERGEVVRYAPFTTELPHRKSWSTLRVERDGAKITTYMNDVAAGTFETSLPVVGHFGFRGCGRARTHVRIRNITMHFEDPEAAGRAWTVRETFAPPVYRKPLLAGAAMVALIVVLLRSLRNAVLCGYLENRRRGFIWADTAGFLVAVAAARLLAAHPAVVTLPATLASAEIWTLVCFAWARRRGGKGDTVPARPVVAAYAAMLIALTLVTLSRYGPWLGRASRSIWPILEHVDAHAFLLSPEAAGPSPSYELRDPVRIRPGRPFFPDGAVYREVDIDLDFTITTNCTFDVVFQQQSFRTRGDPGGEEIPLQRRMVRLSTHDRVHTGLVMGTHRDPGRVLPLDAEVLVGVTNNVRIVAHAKGIEVELNGGSSLFEGFTPLGLGEVGFMVYEDGVVIQHLTMQPLDAGVLRSGWTPAKGMLGWFIYLAVGCGVVRLFARVSVGETLPLLLCIPFAIALYLTTALALSPEVWAGLGRTRFIWLDVALLGSAIMLFLPLVAFTTRMRFAPLLFNVLFIVMLAGAAPLSWDLLPLEHPLRVRFGGVGHAPAEGTEGDRSGPWYSHSRGVGANSYVWKQRFGPNPLPPSKAPDQVRVFVVGGSQAWGSGAASSFDTFDALLEKRLRTKGLPVEVLNAGVNGAGIGSVALIYHSVLAQFDPDILVADVGLNDSVALKMIRNEERRATMRGAIVKEFTEMADACLASGVSLVLVLEAMSSESPLRPDLELYEALTTVVRERGFPVVDATAVMRQKEKDQMLWWDPAHYAPAGHEVLALLMEPTVEAAVRARAESR